MRKIIYRTFLAWNFEKEEAWLNSMASQGYHLVDVGFMKYVFEQGVPGDRIVRMQFLDRWPCSHTNTPYLEFMETTGALEVGRLGRWIYFSKRADQGPFEIFSDLDSKLTMLKSQLVMFFVLALSQTIILFTNVINYINNPLMRGVIRPVVVLLCGTTLLMYYALWRIYRIYKRIKTQRMLHE